MVVLKRRGLGLTKAFLVLVGVSALFSVAVGTRRGGGSLDQRSHRHRHSGRIEETRFFTSLIMVPMTQRTLPSVLPGHLSLHRHRQRGGKEGQVLHRSKRGWVWNQFFVIEEYTGPDPVLVGRVSVTQTNRLRALQNLTLSPSHAFSSTQTSTRETATSSIFFRERAREPSSSSTTRRETSTPRKPWTARSRRSTL